MEFLLSDLFWKEIVEPPVLYRTVHHGVPNEPPNQTTNQTNSSSSSCSMSSPTGRRKQPNDTTEIRVAFLGNSILYFNDCPRVFERMLETRFSKVTQNSCLRGGTSILELWTQGNGMTCKFATGQQPRSNGTYDIGAPSVQALLHNNSWDFCVINDFTQGPARAKTREESKLMLQRCYAPLFRKCRAVPIILLTAAYRKPIRGTDDLGNVDEWTRRLEEGCQEYVQVLSKELPETQAPLLAPVGNAYLKIRNDNLELWKKLFYRDNFHPSPHGTWLQACVLYCTIVGEAPPTYDPNIWHTCRYMQRRDKEPSPLPTIEEADILRQYACDVCNVSTTVPFKLANL